MAQPAIQYITGAPDPPWYGDYPDGVAQGYITDRVAAVLRDRGLGNILINVGEVAALGGRPDGQDWRAGIADPSGQLVHQITLRDRALATSAPLGTVLDSAGNVGHILDPRPDQHVAKHPLVSVSADNAAMADGLSDSAVPAGKVARDVGCFSISWCAGRVFDLTGNCQKGNVFICP